MSEIRRYSILLFSIPVSCSQEHDHTKHSPHRVKSQPVPHHTTAGEGRQGGRGGGLETAGRGGCSDSSEEVFDLSREYCPVLCTAIAEDVVYDEGEHDLTQLNLEGSEEDDRSLYREN